MGTHSSLSRLESVMPECEMVASSSSLTFINKPATNPNGNDETRAEVTHSVQSVLEDDKIQLMSTTLVTGKNNDFSDPDQNRKHGQAARLIIHHATDLPESSYHVVVRYENTYLNSTTRHNTMCPKWDFEVDITLSSTSPITVSIIDENQSNLDGVIGETYISLGDFDKSKKLENECAKLSNIGYIYYSLTEHDVENQQDIRINPNSNTLSIPTAYQLPTGTNILVSHSIQLPSNVILGSISTTQSVSKHTVLSKTHIESLGKEVISIEDIKDRKASVKRDIVIPELSEIGIKYPVDEIKDAEAEFEKSSIFKRVHISQPTNQYGHTKEEENISPKKDVSGNQSNSDVIPPLERTIHSVSLESEQITSDTLQEDQKDTLQELIELIDSLDEKTSKVVYENLQIIMEDINEK